MSESRFEQYIAMIDFDLCINNSNYPIIGDNYDNSEIVLNKWFSQGIYIIINTCRNGRAALEAEVWLLKCGINFHKLNQQHPNAMLHYGNERKMDHGIETRKIWGHVNIDDTNIQWVLNGHPGWHTLDRCMQQIIINLGPDNKYNIKPNQDYSYAK